MAQRYSTALGYDRTGIHGLISFPPQELLDHCYSICQWKLFHIKCHSRDESLPSHVICLADSVVFWVLSKTITHRWDLNIIKQIRIISATVRFTETAALGLGSVLLSGIPELRVLRFLGVVGREINPLRFHSWSSRPFDRHTHGYGGEENSVDAAGK